MNNVQIIANKPAAKAKIPLMRRLGGSATAKCLLFALAVEAHLLFSGCTGSAPQKLTSDPEIALVDNGFYNSGKGRASIPLAQMSGQIEFAASAIPNATFFSKLPSTVKSISPSNVIDVQPIADVNNMLSRQEPVIYSLEDGGHGLEIDTSSRTSQPIFSNGEFRGADGKLEIGHNNWKRKKGARNELGYDSASVVEVISSSYVSIQDSDGKPILSQEVFDQLNAIGKSLGAAGDITGSIYWVSPDVNSVVNYFVVVYNFSAYFIGDGYFAEMPVESRIFAIPKSMMQTGANYEGQPLGASAPSFLVRRDGGNAEAIGILPGFNQKKDPSTIVVMEKPFDIEFFPVRFKLEQNFPNPFNPTTTIRYDIPRQAAVSVKIYDLAGQEVASFANGAQMPGRHEFTFNACNLASGVYFYRLSLDGEPVASEKMLLVK